MRDRGRRGRRRGENAGCGGGLLIFDRMAGGHFHGIRRHSLLRRVRMRMRVCMRMRVRVRHGHGGLGHVMIAVHGMRRDHLRIRRHYALVRMDVHVKVGGHLDRSDAGVT